MDDIDEIIRRLDHWIKVWGYLDADGRSKGIKYLQDAVTALQQMQKNYNRVFQRALDAEQKNKEFNEQFSKHQSTWWDNEDKLQQRIAELENDNQELANAIEETDKLNSERIAELEKGYQLQKSNAGSAYEQIKRLDAALKEISLGVVAPMDFAKKAREGK